MNICLYIYMYIYIYNRPTFEPTAVNAVYAPAAPGPTSARDATVNGLHNLSMKTTREACITVWMNHYQWPNSKLIVNNLRTVVKQFRVERQKAARRDHSLPVVRNRRSCTMGQEEATGTRAVRCRMWHEIRKLLTNYWCLVYLYPINFNGLYALIRLQWTFCLFLKCLYAWIRLQWKFCLFWKW